MQKERANGEFYGKIAIYHDDREMRGAYTFITENKWLILLTFEILAWAATFFMLYARYRMQSRLWFRVAVGIGVLTGVIPQVSLGVVNFAQTREIDVFTAVVALLLAYGLTVGKNHVRRLDAWAKRRFAGKREEGG